MDKGDPDDSRIQEVIVQKLSEVEDAYTDRFVPQSKLWELISQMEFDFMQSDGNKLWRSFLYALCGKKNSFSLFESCEDPDSCEIKWRIRSQNLHSLPLANHSHTTNEKTQIEELQQTVRTLRMQTSILESDNRQYRVIVDRLKRETPPEVQKNFDFYETLYGFIQGFEQSFREADERMNQINTKITEFM